MLISVLRVLVTALANLARCRWSYRTSPALTVVLLLYAVTTLIVYFLLPYLWSTYMDQVLAWCSENPAAPGSISSGQASE